MPSFKKIRERAARRKGGEATLNKLLGAKPNNAALANVPDNRILSTSWRGYWLLVGAILLLIMVEVLNTGIEAACDAVSREFHIDIQLAKDCGSLAVLISILIALIVWGLAVVETICGVPL